MGIQWVYLYMIDIIIYLYMIIYDITYKYTQFKSSLIFLTLRAIFDIELTLKNA